MNEEEKKEFDELKRQMKELSNFIDSYKNGGSSLVKIIARTADTTPGGGIIINTPDGPITLLRV